MQKTVLQTFCMLLFLTVTTASIPQAAETGKPGAQKASISLAGDYFPADNFDSVRTQISSRLPLGQIGDYRVNSKMEFGYRHTGGSTTFPEDLYRAGATISLANAKNRFELGLSSASDELFHSIDETNISLSATREVKRWQNSSLHLGMAYFSRMGFPLPVFLYTYNDEDLTCIVGVPVTSLRWRIHDMTTLVASYRPVRQASLGLEQELSPTLTLILEGAIEEDSYDIAGRADPDKSLVLEIPKATLKLEQQMSAQLSCNLTAGRTFNARFFKREGFNGKVNEVQIDNAWIAGLGLKTTF